MAKVMISLPDKFLKAVDTAARSEHRSRSELIREAVRTYVHRGQRYKRPIDDPAVRKAYEHLTGNPFRWTGKLNSTQVIRKMRDTRYADETSGH